jgi:hypothetical protein
MKPGRLSSSAERVAFEVGADARGRNQHADSL